MLAEGQKERERKRERRRDEHDANVGVEYPNEQKKFHLSNLESKRSSSIKHK